MFKISVNLSIIVAVPAVEDSSYNKKGNIKISDLTVDVPEHSYEGGMSLMFIKPFMTSDSGRLLPGQCCLVKCIEFCITLVHSSGTSQ